MVKKSLFDWKGAGDGGSPHFRIGDLQCGVDQTGPELHDSDSESTLLIPVRSKSGAVVIDLKTSLGACTDQTDLHLGGLPVFDGVVHRLLSDSVEVGHLRCVFKLDSAVRPERAVDPEQLLCMDSQPLQTGGQTFAVHIYRYEPSCQLSGILIRLPDQPGDLMRLFGQGVFLLFELSRHLLADKADTGQHLTQSVVQVLPDPAPLIFTGSQNLLLQASLFRDIPHNPSEEPLIPQMDFTDGQIEREGGPVPFHAGYFTAVADDFPGPSVQIVVDVVVMLLPVGLRHQNVDIFPEYFRLFILEELLGRLVESPDQSALIDGDDGINGCLDNTPVPGFTLPQLLLHNAPLDLVLRHLLRECEPDIESAGVVEGLHNTLVETRLKHLIEPADGVPLQNRNQREAVREIGCTAQPAQPERVVGDVGEDHQLIPAADHLFRRGALRADSGNLMPSQLESFSEGTQ